MTQFVLSVPSLSIEYFERMKGEFSRTIRRDTRLEGEFYDSRGSQSEQVSHLNDAISRDVDFILASPIRDEAIAPIVEKAKNRNIPFICVDRNVSSVEPTSHISSDNTRLGIESVQLLAEFMSDGSEKSEYNIIEIQGTNGASVTKERHTGGMKAVENTEINYLDSRPGKFSTSEAASVTNRLIEKYGSRIDGIYAHNDEMAIGARRTIADSELGDIPITGIDGSKSWIERFETGSHFGTIAQLPEQMVTTGIEHGKRAVEGESVQNSKQIPGERVTAENANKFLSKYFRE